MLLLKKTILVLKKDSAGTEQDNAPTEEIEDEEMEHVAMDITTSTPTSDVQHGASAAMINRICGFLVKHLRQKPNDDPITQNKIMDTFPTINEQSTAPTIKIFTFFWRFVLQVNEADIDDHMLVNLHGIDMCNAVLQSTGYGRYSRKITPEPSMGTLHALHINLHEKVEKLCSKRKVDFDNKIIITSPGIIHLQGTYYKKESSYPSASSTFDHKVRRHKGSTEDD
ncbi:hypothetical protein BC941DRAFT_476031 [Chlamydoabsidia padenii]|nr:hypothetical protein BC941DRAFT_476031 [Chlamydoabsidia padenii]